MMNDLSTKPFKAPGRGRGILDAIRNRYLLRLLVDKEIRCVTAVPCWVSCGLTLSRVSNFGVFYIAMGLFLGLERGMHNYAIYLFAGMIVINFFSEGFGNGARAMVVNSALIRKIYLPRELFSLSTVWVALIHFLPQIVVMLIACIFSGWKPGVLNIASVVAGMLIVMLLSYGLGLIFGVANVFFRDSETWWICS